MTPEKYIKVKEIFLQAAERPAAEREGYVAQACGGDQEVEREVQSLLKEHSREVKVIADDPEGPLGPMSAILSRANVELPKGVKLGSSDALPASGEIPEGRELREDEQRHEG